MKNSILVIAALICFAFSYLKTGINPSNYKIYASKNKAESTVNDIVLEMKNYDIVFFGEEHNDSVAHFLQLELLKGLY